MSIEPQNDVDSIVANTKKALANSNMFISSPGQLHLGGRNNISLYGEDAALDFIESEWRSVIDHLNDVARSKGTQVSIRMPLMGLRAKARIEQFVSSAMPRVKVAVTGATMSIDWSGLI